MKKLISVMLTVIFVIFAFSVGVFAESVRLDGLTTVYKPVAGKITKLQYSLVDINTGAKVNNAIWSIKENDLGLSVNSTGMVFLSNAIALTQFTLTAVRADDSSALAELKITVKNPVVFNFETDSVGLPPVGLDSNYKVNVALEENGNKYIPALSATRAAYTIPTDLQTKGPVSLSARIRREVLSGNENAVISVTNATSDWMPVMYTNTDSINPNNIMFISFPSGTTTGTYRLGAVPPATWADIQILYDFNNRQYSYYLNGNVVADKFLIPTNKDSNFLKQIMFYLSFDDVAIYSGSPVKEANIVTDIPKNVAIASTIGKTTVVPLNAVLNLDGSKSGFGIEWSLVGSYSGVQIKNSMLYIDDNAQMGNISLTASALNGQYTTSADIELVNGYHYDFETDTEGSVPTGMITTATVISGGIEGNYLDSDGKNASLTIPDFNGRISVQADIRKKLDGASSILLSGIGGEIAVMLTRVGDSLTASVNGGAEKSISSPDDWHKLKIIYDTSLGLYTALIGNTALALNTPIGMSALTDVALSVDFDNLSINNTISEPPMAINPSIKGNITTNQTVTAEYSYFAPDLQSKTSEQINWYIGTSLSGTFTKVGSGNSYRISKQDVHSYLKFSVQCSNSSGTGDLVYSNAVEINAPLNAVVAGNTINLDVYNVLGGNDLLAFVLCYDSNQVSTGALMKKITFTPGQNMVSPTFDISGINYSSMQIVLVGAADLRPFGNVKIGAVDPNTSITTNKNIEVKDGRIFVKGLPNVMTTVIAYKPYPTGSGVMDAFSATYSKRDLNINSLNPSSQANVNNIIYDYRVIETDSNGIGQMPFVPTAYGAYNIIAISEMGVTTELMYANKADVIFGSDAVTNMNDPKFKIFLNEFTDKSQATIDIVYDYYQSLADKNKLITLMKGEGGNLNMFYVTTMLCKLAESSSVDSTLNTALTDALTTLGIDSRGIALLAQNAGYTEATTVLKTQSFNTVSNFAQAIFDTAILKGVLYAINYKDVAKFLEALNIFEYTVSSYKDDICSFVAGKSYATITDLINAVKGFVPPKPINTTGGVSGGRGSSSPSIQGTIYNEPIATNKTPILKDISGHWAYDSIMLLAEKNIISGTPQGYFYPDNHITRAEFVKIICSAFNIPLSNDSSFKDVADGDWFKPYVATASNAQIVTGYNGEFRPLDNINREDVAVIINRVSLYKGISLISGTATFEDTDKISHYAKEAVENMMASGIISGMGNGYFEPKELTTRAQASKIVASILALGGN